MHTEVYFSAWLSGEVSGTSDAASFQRTFRVTVTFRWYAAQP